MGLLAQYRQPARLARFAGMTALACIMANAILPMSAHAQGYGIQNNGVSENSEMLLEADTVVYDNDQNTVTAIGAVQIDYDGNRLVAQRVRYDQRTSRLIATGGVEIVDRDGNRIFSDEIDVTDDFRDAFVQSLRVETADKTYFAAESAERREGDVTTFNYGVYTACAPCEDKPEKPPIWRVKAQKIIWNGKTKTVRFERARFEMFGFPLAFLPALEIADPNVNRKTGFLTPSYRFSDPLGHGVTVPYYMALDPSYDLTLKPSFYTKQGFLAEGEWRQRFNNGEYSITAAGIYQMNPQNFGTNTTDDERLRGMIGSKGRFQINPRWTFGWDVMAQSDKNFAYRYAISGYNQDRRTNEVYLTGLNDRNYFDLRAYHFNVAENTRDGYGNTRNDRQPWVLPSFDYSYIPDEAIAGGELKLNINLQSLHRRMMDQPTDGRILGIKGSSTRLTAEAEWKRTFITDAGLVLTPLLHARGDAINVSYDSSSVTAINNFAASNGVGADIRSAYYRAMATAGLEARYPILFSTSSSTHVLEPMGQIFARPDAPYGNTVGIPNEDAQSMVFDAASLFRHDKFSGYDRIEGGVRANVGIRYSGNFGNGWSAHGLFGQSFHLAGQNPYASPDLVHVGAASGLQTDRSDYVASLGLVTPVGISFGAGARFDQANFKLRRTDISAGYNTNLIQTSAVYSYIDKQPEYGFSKERHEVRGTASVRIMENWRVFGSGTYDLTNNVMVKKSIGFAYDDECFSYAITAAEDINPFNTSDKKSSFGFQISLRTIGDFGMTTGN